MDPIVALFPNLRPSFNLNPNPNSKTLTDPNVAVRKEKIARFQLAKQQQEHEISLLNARLAESEEKARRAVEKARVLKEKARHHVAELEAQITTLEEKCKWATLRAEALQISGQEGAVVKIANQEKERHKQLKLAS